MRKLVLALSAVLVLASFTNSTNNTIILKDIDGTLLQSYPVIETIDGNYKITLAPDPKSDLLPSVLNDIKVTAENNTDLGVITIK